MAKKQFVRCIKGGARDGKTGVYYHNGDEDWIDPLDPIAQYFDGWTPGTEVYLKTRGDKNNDPVVGTRIVPGTPPLTEEEEAAAKVERDEKQLAKLAQEKRDREAQGFAEPVETDESPEMFRCKECDWETEHESALARHMTMEHPEVDQPDD